MPEPNATIMSSSLAQFGETSNLSIRFFDRQYQIISHEHPYLNCVSSSRIRNSIFSKLVCTFPSHC